MKRKLFLLAGIMALMVSCHSDIDELEVSSSSFLIRLFGELGQTTRIDDNGFCDGDQIGLYGVNYTNSNATAGTLLDSGNQVDNARYTYDEDNRQWNSTGSIYYKDAKTNIDLYAYYPYGAPESVNDYAFGVLVDQSGASVNDGYAMSDFLWGKAENVKPSNDKVKIRFSHRLSNAVVILAEGEGFAEGEFESLEKSVLVNNTIRTASIDLATGIAVPDGEVSAEGIVMRATTDGYRAVVVPQTIDGGVVLYTITVDGIVYRFKPSNDFTFEAGKQSKFTIEVSKKSMTGEYEFTLIDTDIVEWVSDIETHAGEARQYYVVNQEKPGTLGELIRADKKNPNKIKNLKISGKIDARDFGFMRDSMEMLQAVNLKESEIVEGWSWRLENYNDNNSETRTKTFYFEGKMPSSSNDRWQMFYEKYPDFNSDGWGWYDPEGYDANEIPAYAFGNATWSDGKKSNLVYFSFPEKVTKIGKYAFGGTLLSGALVIPSDVTEIGDYAFAYTDITSLELPHHLVKIGNEAFSGCASLGGSLSLPESLEELGSSAFSGCRLLTGTLSVPSKISKIPSGCFGGCGFTGDLVIPEGIVEIGGSAFDGCSSLTGQLSLPTSLKKIGGSAFGHCGLQGELVIPGEIQVIPSYCFYNNGFSSIIFAENSELLKIEEAAFAWNQRLSEPVILPEGLLTIGSRVFEEDRMLPSVSIPSSVNTIGESAFSFCYGMSSLVCNVVTPPVLGKSVFDGVAKDNFTLEVPEQSVSKYQTSAGWSDFRRISAHHDFAISRSMMRALNAKYSRTYVLRVPAGLAWSIESKPDWVTITPSSGVGKAEVTVTVDELQKSDVTSVEIKKEDEWGNIHYDYFDGRTGEIVFLLNEKDYRSTMKVEQYDSDHYDGEIIVNQQATKGAGVNIVFMGDGFDACDIAKNTFTEGLNEAIGYYFGIEPYKSYKEYFNIYTVIGMSADSGIGTENTVKDSKYDSKFDKGSWGWVIDDKKIFTGALQVPTVNEFNLNNSLVVMIENTTDYGGVTYMWCDGSAIAICPMSRDAYPFDFRGIVQHEAGGHGFAKLADEYIYHNAYIDVCPCSCCPHLEGPDGFYAGKACGWYRNLSTNGDMKTVEWAHLIFHPDYSNIVDMYEGGYFHTRGIYRSEANSCMNNNIPYYSAIQRQEMVERIKRYAGEEFSLEEFYAKDVRDASNNDFTTTRGGSLEVEDTPASRASAAKQMHPKIMGDKPILK